MPLTDRLPTPRVQDPAKAPPLRWGVIGTGWIAERFVDGLQSHTRQRVVAAGSRTETGAAAFAGRFGIPRVHGSYEALVGDPEVDVVYVATPHPSHLPHGLLALDAGKHVLIEKPLALNAREACELKARAAELDLYCAEAMWTLFTPKFDVIRQILDARMLGELRTVIVDFGEWFAADHRIMQPELAGGPLLDLGSYPLSLAHWVLGPPTEIIARGIPAPSGVNGQASVLVHDGDAHSVITTSIFSNTPTGATIAGTEGTITIQASTPSRGVHRRLRRPRDHAHLRGAAGRVRLPRVRGRRDSAADRRWDEVDPVPAYDGHGQHHGDHRRSSPSNRHRFPGE